MIKDILNYPQKSMIFINMKIQKIQKIIKLFQNMKI